MSVAVQHSRGPRLMTLHEIIQALSVSAGVITSMIGLVLMRVRMRGAQELRKIDVSAEWQTQMITRIATVEAELQRERIRGDELERDGFEWRRQATELRWELKAAQEQREAQSREMDELRHENGTLKKQNDALAHELRELYRQVRGGHQTLSMPPLPRKTRPDR